MLRITLAALVVATGITAFALVPSCTVTNVGEGEGEGGAGEGEGGGGEGEGEGGGGVENTDALCSDHLDNDGDGHVDCDDFDCSGTAPCAETNCSDGLDNDGNTFIDCADHACGGDATHPPSADCIHAAAIQIQDVKDGTFGEGFTVSINPVVVTATKVAGSGNLTLFVQEANGVTKGALTYPEDSGVGVFIKSDQVAGFGATGVAIGDCVTLTGKVGSIDFAAGTVVSVQPPVGQTQISFLTAFSKGVGGCGAAPAPIVKTVASVNDTGADADKLEGTLVTIQDVSVTTASTGTSGSFTVTAAAGGATIFVGGFLLAPPPNFALATHFTSITGVLSESDDLTDPAHPVVRYNIEPRIAADLVTP